MNMKDPKKSRIVGFLRDERARARLLSGLTVAMMMVAAVSGMMLLSQPAAASTYTYTENFDDETTGTVVNGTTPDEAWYNMTTNDPSGFSIDDTTYNGASGKSLRCSHDGIGSKELDLDLTTATAIDYCQYYTYFHNQQIFLIFANESYVGSCDTDSLNENAGPWIKVDSSSIQYKDSTGTLVSITSSTSIADTWALWNFTFNYTTHKFQVEIGGTAYGWYDFRAPINNIKKIIFWDGNDYPSDFYIDDIKIGSPTDLEWGGGGGGSPPFAPSSPSASAYSVFDISASGLDANSRITFPTAYVNDTSGDTVWSNNTAYGNLTITNDGIMQINLSWTNDPNADWTIIEYDTSDHSPWNFGTGTEFYNETTATGSSTVFDSTDYAGIAPGTTYYFALFSMNASGISDTPTKCNAQTGNVSVSYINITILDIGNATASLPKQNITVYENGGGSFSAFGQFNPDYGSINKTSNGVPLAIGESITFRFKAVWGAGQHPSGTYYDGNDAALGCTVKGGR